MKHSTIDHIAIQVTNIGNAIIWYQQRFDCAVLYQDQSWALLQFDNVKLALVLPKEHPAHVCIKHANPEQFGPLSSHRDGSESVYIKDIDNNTVEIIGQ